MFSIVFLFWIVNWVVRVRLVSALAVVVHGVIASWLVEQTSRELGGAASAGLGVSARRGARGAGRGARGAGREGYGGNPGQRKGDNDERAHGASKQTTQPALRPSSRPAASRTCCKPCCVTG